MQEVKTVYIFKNIQEKRVTKLDIFTAVCFNSVICTRQHQVSAIIKPEEFR